MSVEIVTGYEAWRARARALLNQGTPPAQIVWKDAGDPQEVLPLALSATASEHPAASGTSSLNVQFPARGDVAIGEAGAPAGRPTGEASTTAAVARVPRRFLDLSAKVSCHRRPDRWDVLYRLLWRLQHENAQLLDLDIDPDVGAAGEMASQVRRDEHKMRAFVRFVPVQDGDGVRYVAWYRPDHLIVRLAAPFFADRFSSMRWSILTPDLSAHWDHPALTFTEGVAAPMQTDGGSIEALWRTYYAAVFNPARLNVPAMLREMPLRRWQMLPEATLIPGLIGSAQERAGKLASAAASESARPFVPATTDLDQLRASAPACRGCELYSRATQVVFGEGPRNARLVLVGEQPGDREDIEGRPFVGPAGDVLKRALAAAGLDPGELFITNAVKHFSFEERGKRRIHKTPRTSEVRACRPWLEAELHAIRPACVVCLGSTAARALLGPQTRVMESRARVIAGTAWAEAVVVTVHPSAVLRSDDGGERYFEMLVSDLTLAARACKSGEATPSLTGEAFGRERS